MAAQTVGALSIATILYSIYSISKGAILFFAALPFRRLPKSRQKAEISARSDDTQRTAIIGGGTGSSIEGRLRERANSLMHYQRGTDAANGYGNSPSRAAAAHSIHGRMSNLHKYTSHTTYSLVRSHRLAASPLVGRT